MGSTWHRRIVHKDICKPRILVGLVNHLVHTIIAKVINFVKEALGLDSQEFQPVALAA